MGKHAKRAFGIFHDGLIVRMVELFRDGSEIRIQAIDYTELDRYWYKIQEDPAVSLVDAKTKEDFSQPKSDMKIDDFDSDYVTNYQLQPCDRMLAAFNLAHGVIALNVYEENIVRDIFGAVSSKEMAQFVKSKAGAKNLKTGEWQSSIVTIDGQQQHWLHRGNNRLFDLLQDQQRQNRYNYYYQMADANDIVLTDFFKVTYENNLIGGTLLVYLGQEYRKAFVFREGEWVDTLKLQITQDNPDKAVISSKLSLAIDSAHLKEPDKIVFCGDIANTDLVDFIKTQFVTAQIELINFSNHVGSIDDNDVINKDVLSQYTIPIALAYKALFFDAPAFTDSNFLPYSVLEGQKEFKIAWHGFIVLFLIFGLTLWSTFSILKANQDYRQGKVVKRRLDFTLAQKKLEASEIQKIRTDLENQEKNIEVLRLLLENKNPWTEILSIANRVFARESISWLVNLKRVENRFVMSGVTTKRDNIISLANEFPNSQIQRVTSSRLRGKTLWNFEIVADFPNIDWIGEIEKDIESIRTMKQNYGVAETNNNTPPIMKPAPVTKVTPLSPSRNAKVLKTDKRGRVILPPIQQSSCPIPTEEQTSGNAKDTADYRSFVQSINKGNIWEYRELGMKFQAEHSDSALIPAVRWWLCYRLYLDREFALSTQHLEPMLRTVDRYYPYALLLQARIDYATGNKRYEDLYKQLRMDYSQHLLADQVSSDWKLITGDGAN